MFKPLNLWCRKRFAKEPSTFSFIIMQSAFRRRWDSFYNRLYSHGFTVVIFVVFVEVEFYQIFVVSTVLPNSQTECVKNGTTRGESTMFLQWKQRFRTVRILFLFIIIIICDHFVHPLGDHLVYSTPAALVAAIAAAAALGPEIVFVRLLHTCSLCTCVVYAMCAEYARFYVHTLQAYSTTVAVFVGSLRTLGVLDKKIFEFPLQRQSCYSLVRTHTDGGQAERARTDDDACRRRCLNVFTASLVRDHVRMAPNLYCTNPRKHSFFEKYTYMLRYKI